MRLVIVLSLAGLLALICWIMLQHDLRGWPPADFRNPSAIVSRIGTDGRDFTIRECLPGTIHPWNNPRADEYHGHATATVLSCRSRTSALFLLLGYLAIVGGVFLLVHRRRR